MLSVLPEWLLAFNEWNLTLLLSVLANLITSPSTVLSECLIIIVGYCPLVPVTVNLLLLSTESLSLVTLILFNFVWSASVKTLLSVADSTSVLISAAVWSAVALASIAFSFEWSVSYTHLTLPPTPYV